MLKDYQYNGETNGAHWRLAVRPYLISKVPEIAEILDYVEKHEDTEMLIKDITGKASVPYATIAVLATDFWGFLTFNLQGIARV